MLCRALCRNTGGQKEEVDVGKKGWRIEMSLAELWLLFAARLWACNSCAASAAVFLKHIKN